MTYQGYMALANDDGETIELVNASRVKAYTDNLAPSIGLRGCDDCEGLDEALGETYTNPRADNAPWFDPTDPATADFYGVYPLGFEGIDDSTRTIESAELSGDGSVVVGSRFSGKDIRVSGMAFAKDEAALYAGVSWLDTALNGTEDGRCFGDRLNLFSSCPPIQVLPPDFATPWTLPVPVTQAEIDAWTTTSGTITYSPGNEGTDPGLRFDWQQGDPQKIACREITGLIPGEQYQFRAEIENFGDYYVRIGESCATSQTNLAPNPRLLGWPWQGGGVLDVEADVATGGPLGLGYRQSITTSTNTSSPYSILMPADEYIPVTEGTLYQVSMYVMGPVGSARLSVSFRNDVGATIASDVRLQQGLAMDNTWKRMSGVVVAPINAVSMEVFIAISHGVGTIQPNMTFGAANLLIEHPRYDVQRTSLATDPRGIDPAMWAFFSGTGGAAAASSIAGAVDGPVLYGTTQSTTYRRHTVTTAPTGGSAGPLGRAESSIDFPDEIEAGTPWVTGAFFRSNRAITGTSYHRLLGPGNVVVQEFTKPFSMPANTWTYISGGTTAAATYTDVEEAYVWLVVGGLGGGATLQVGDVYDATGLLAQIGSADPEYFDSLRPPEGLTAYIPQFLGASDGASEVLADATGTYFDGFTDGFHWDGPVNDSSSSSDLGIDYQIVTGWSEQPPSETTVLDFIPRTESVFLSITPTQLGTAVELNALLIERALVRRIARPGVVAYGSGNEFVPPSDGWTHLAPAGAKVVWVAGADSDGDTVRTDAQAPFAGGLTYTSAHGPQRTVFGLIPGNRYRILMQFFEGWHETDTDPTLDSVNPFMEISNSEGAVATFTVNNTNSHFWVIEFTATATSSLVALHPTASLALGSYGTVTWSFDQYMVEEILPTDATEPRPGRFQERTMYEVKASQGPILTNVRTSPCGVMGQISFSLRAGNPFKYRAPIFAGGLPTGTSQVVGDIPCSADGLPQIINFAYNPSLETNDADWLAGGTNMTFSGRVASPTARVGGFVYRATATGSGIVSSITSYYDVSHVTGGPVPLAGEEITVSTYVRATATAWTGVHPWDMYVTMQGFPAINFDGTVNVATAGVWYRIEQTFFLPSNVSLELIELRVLKPDFITSGGGMERDGLMIQRGGQATEPFDETTPGAQWSSTPNTSALVLTPMLDDISEDPDCPTPPAPPAPPVIDDACITEPTSYNRTVVNISADTVPQNLTAYPVITLTAGSAAVRQARIRFWENPDNLTIDELDPCDYDGEIIVSYLADGATMVINGVLREATVSKPGFAEVNANHVLYGPDGGPVDWPELSGGIPYLVTLELDSGEAYSDTLMSIDLVVKD